MKNSVGCVFIVLRTKYKRVHAMFYSPKNSSILMTDQNIQSFFGRHIIIFTFRVVSTSKNDKTHIVYRLRRLGTIVTMENITWYCNTSNNISTLSLFITVRSIQKSQQKIIKIVFSPIHSSFRCGSYTINVRNISHCTWWNMISRYEYGYIIMFTVKEK